MATLKKIGTCSYCQARVVISVTAGSRHELACTACGAPLEHTEIVAQHSSQAEESVDSRESARRERERDRERDRNRRDQRWDRKKDKRQSRSSESDRKSKRKPRKRGLRYWFKKLVDEIEDLFD